MAEKEIKLTATQLIETLYQIDKHKLRELSKDFNFLENVSYFKKINGRTSQVESFLAENIVNTLPIETYKELITLEGWFSGGNRDSNPISIALYDKKFEFINVVLNLLDKKIKEAEDFEKNRKSINVVYVEEHRIYSNLILERILSFPIRESFSDIGYNKKDVEGNFFNIFLKSLDLYLRAEKYMWIGARERDLKEFSFIEKLDSLKNVNVDSHKLLRESCEQKSMYVFFAKIVNELSEEKRQEIKSWPNKSFLSKALFAQNKQVSNVLIKEKIYCSRAIIDIIDTVNEKVLEESKLCNGDFKLYKEIFNTCEMLLSESELNDIPAYKLMGLLYLNKENVEQSNLVLQKYPQILVENVIDEESLAEVKLLKELEDIFSKKYNVNFDKLNENAHYVSIKELINFSVEEINKNEIVDKIRQSSKGILSKFKMAILSELNKNNSSKESVIILENELLNFSLPNKSIEEKKKLKI